MTTCYARYDKNSNQLSIHFQEEVESLGGSALIFDPVLERYDSSPGDRFRKLESTLRLVDSVIFRVSSQDHAQIILEDPILRDFAKYQRIMVLVIDIRSERHSRPLLLELSGAMAPFQESICAAIGKLEVMFILTTSNAIYERHDVHYVLPSGRHAQKFVRFADALINPIDIVRIADWVMPHLIGASGVLVDSGTILPLLYEICDRLRVSPQSYVEVLQAYKSENYHIRDQVRELKRRVGHHIVAIISVNGSGKMRNRVRDELDKEDDLIVLCDTGQPSESPAVPRIVEIPVQQYDVNSVTMKCDHCDRLAAIHIDPLSYEGIFKPEVEPIKVDFRKAAENIEFWKIVNRIPDAIKYHVTVPFGKEAEDDVRHFGIYIDVCKLLDDLLFRSAIYHKLAKYLPVDIVIIPENASTERLEKFVRDYDICGKIVIAPWGNFQEFIRQEVSWRKRILILDDAIVTGSRLRSLRREVYNATRVGVVDDVEVIGFALIARPPNKTVLDQTRNSYYDPGVNKFIIDWGYRLFLPRIGAENCPWCRERKVLKSFARNLSDESERVRRERILELEKSPIEYPLILKETEDVIGTVIKGSMFGDLHSSVAFAACISATQLARNEVNEKATGPRQLMIDLNHAISAFYDSVLLAAILRTSTPLELGGPFVEREITENLLNGGIEISSDDNIAELLLAALEGKLPANAVLRAVNEMDHEHRVIGMLKELLSIRCSE